MFAAAWLLLCTPTAMAHTVFLFLSLEDGKLRIESGFSDGGTGVGLPVEIRDAATGTVLESHQMPENGVLVLAPPTTEYTVTLDAGEGHRITKPGPALAAETVTQAQIVNVHWGDVAMVSQETKDAIAKAKVVVTHDWLYGRIQSLFENQTVVLIEPGVSLREDSPSAAKLRDKIRTRIRASFEKAEQVLMLSPVAAAEFPDWQWLIEEGLAVAYAPPPIPAPQPAKSAVPEL